MVVEFTTNFVDSSYLECLMFKKKGFMKWNMPKNRIFSLFIQKNNNILVEFFFFFSENGWNCLRRNKGVKYIGECKIKYFGPYFFAQFSPIKYGTKHYPWKNNLK